MSAQERPSEGSVAFASIPLRDLEDQAQHDKILPFKVLLSSPFSFFLSSLPLSLEDTGDEWQSETVQDCAVVLQPDLPVLEGGAGEEQDLPSAGSPASHREGARPTQGRQVTVEGKGEGERKRERETHLIVVLISNERVENATV
jgi:hypothetical protein